MSQFNDIFSNAFDSIIPPIYGETVEYIREGEDAFDVVAMPSEISTDQKLEWGASLTTNSREFEIAVEDMPFEPARNDTIKETINGVITYYEITEIGNSPAWEFTDSDRKYYILRTVEVFGS